MELWKILLIVVGLFILSTNFVDMSYLVSKLFVKSKKTAELDKEGGFLEIVSLWYQLKNKCDLYHLDTASDKLDEVFPLLNKMLEENNEKVA